MKIIHIKYPMERNKINFDRLDGIEDDLFTLLTEECHIDRKNISIKYLKEESTWYVYEDFDISVLKKIQLCDDEQIIGDKNGT